MGVQERAKERQFLEKEMTIKNQAKVITELWSELQTLKRILITKHRIVWDEIQKNRNHE